MPGLQSGMTVWLSRTVLESLAAEADRGYPLETGGVLAGYFADSGEAVVEHAIGPGPGAVHKRYRFLPDSEWQCERLNELYERSNGVHVYIGDWHTHPDGTGRMSLLDHWTLRAIAKHPAACLANPLMLIGGGKPKARDWICHQHSGERLFGLLSSSSEIPVRVFSSKVSGADRRGE